jgi:uridylate kinase
MTPFSAEMLQMSAYEPGLARHLAEEKKHVIIFGGGLGLRGFSTDMTAVSRAYEVSADIVVKITEVGGMFDSDPKVNKNAKRIPYASYQEVLQKGYKVMDEEAFVFAKNHGIPIKIIDLDTSKIRPKKILNRKHGTLIA